MEYFEELTVGHTESFGRYEVTEDEIVSFAEQYDPQPFHTDADAARESMFGGLVASGWHTAAMTMRLLVDEYIASSRALGAAGVDELRWRKPVEPGDVLTVETEIVETEPWDESRGLVHVAIETTNDEGAPVQTMTALVLWERKEA
ncbi:MaoC family dehydratase [Halomicrobium sp. LC1Hm]|uniref:MaoC family dehydratase n=1 Tax=Halomicrobium sp. LC1Hm TaxID=2610902 RepID=UPI00129846E9|nr:MaoC family dehydratase [Halomicrobium sp. LC1Hm]QGA83178.1 Acyl dehydratase [Halomicrobium sp. LC1Hm]